MIELETNTQRAVSNIDDEANEVQMNTKKKMVCLTTHKSILPDSLSPSLLPASHLRKYYEQQIRTSDIL